MALALERDRRHRETHIGQCRAGVECIATVVASTDEGNNVHPRAWHDGSVRFVQQRGRVCHEKGNTVRNRVTNLAHVHVRVVDLRGLADKLFFDCARLLECHRWTIKC